MSAPSKDTTALPPHVYVDPYNYEFMTPLPFDTALTRPSKPELDEKQPSSPPREASSPFSKLMKSEPDSPKKMFSLFSSSAKYAGYEKAEDLEASDNDSAVGSESTLTSATTQNKSSRIDPRVISDAIIGLSDGMTVPFALTAGLSGLNDSRIVVFGGFAELIAGAISMGLGGYLGAKSEEQSYRETLKETQREVKLSPSETSEKISDIFSSYNVPPMLVRELASHISSSPNVTDFLMRFEHGVTEPAASRAITCALTIALSYFIGGLIPLLPYLLVPRHDIEQALVASCVIMVIALFIFGYCKTCFVSGWSGRGKIVEGMSGGGQMVLVGGLAAGCAMGLVRAFNSFL